MAGFAAWPTDEDLHQFLIAAGAWQTAFTPVVSGYVEAQKTRFEELTGYLPFLAETTPGTAVFDPPGAVSHSALYSWRGGMKVLQLDSGYTEITVVALGYSADSSGNPVDLNRAVKFHPANWQRSGHPITEIEFLFQSWGGVQSIIVTGKRGYFTTIPADVWTAVRDSAAGEFLKTAALYLTGGANKFSEGDSSVDFGGTTGGGAYGPQISQWEDRFKRTVNRYTRVTF